MDIPLKARVIRKMIATDIPRVSEIVCAGYIRLGIAEGYSTDDVDRLCVERGSQDAIISQAEKYAFFVAKTANEVVGIVAISKNVIEKIYVYDRNQNAGIGKALFGFAESYTAENGYDSVTLGSFPSSGGFYLSMGMGRVGEKILTSGPIIGRTIVIFEKKISTIPK